MRRVIYIALDIAVVLIFVAIGLHAHGHRESLGNLVSVAAPFVLGVALGWALQYGRKNANSLLRSGVEIWVITVVVGQVVRLIDGQGSAFGFVVVTIGFLGACMLGWRLVALGINRLGGRSPLRLRSKA